MCRLFFTGTKEKPTPKSRVPLSAIPAIVASMVSIGEVRAIRIGPTNSMEPLIDDNSMCIMLIDPDPGDLIVGDVIVYDRDAVMVPGNMDADDIIHSIVEIGDDGERFFRTKGLNNSRKDSIKVRDDMIVSVLLAIVYVKD